MVQRVLTASSDTKHSCFACVHVWFTTALVSNFPLYWHREHIFLRWVWLLQTWDRHALGGVCAWDNLPLQDSLSFCWQHVFKLFTLGGRQRHLWPQNIGLIVFTPGRMAISVLRNEFSTLELSREAVVWSDHYFLVHIANTTTVQSTFYILLSMTSCCYNLIDSCWKRARSTTGPAGKASLVFCCRSLMVMIITAH